MTEQDRVTGILLGLTVFLLATIGRYSARYMAGDSRRTRFLSLLCLTGVCVLALIAAQSLLALAIAWCAVSLSLHQLLRFYSDRPGAVMAARKKFLVSRLGDAALFAAVVLAWRELGATRFEDIANAATRLHVTGTPATLNLLACLLVFAALLKSAQFPFHSWLPDTMETPTPVSALMHAGIINAGGILIIRLHALISLSEPAMAILCIVGGFTALFGSVVMLTQASVKRCLAFSTVAQMGFMMLECGLGAFHLALLHLVAHSLYKAWAFLASGNAVRTDPKPNHQAISPWRALASLALAATLSLAGSTLVGVSVLDQPILSGIFTLALAQMLWNLPRTSHRSGHLLTGVAIALAASLVYFALDRTAALVIPPAQTGTPSAALTVLAVFALIAALQTRLPAISRTNLAASLYVHARNGFYINTAANRFTHALWPVTTTQEKQ